MMRELKRVYSRGAEWWIDFAVFGADIDESAV
jgi:hypothetical protein